MQIKEKLKKEIDRMPDTLLLQVQKYLESLKNNNPQKRKIPSLHLNGQYDNMNIRQKAYE